MGLSLGQVDEALKAWRTRLSAVAENLLALQTDTAYGALTGTGGLDKVAVKGQTAARVGPALGRMNGLFLQFGALQAVVEQAEALRRGLPAMFGGEAKLRELEQLLFGASVEVEAETPVGERTLVSGTAGVRRVTVEQMLAAMTATFAEVQAAVAAVGAAWTEFAAGYERVERELARLEAQTAMPAARMEAAVADLKARMERLRSEVKMDPVGALAALRTELEPALGAAVGRLAAAEAMAGRLRAARATWEAVQELHTEAVREVEAAGAKVMVVGGAVVSAVRVQGLGEWMERLERRRDELGGGAEALAVGLRNWCAAAEACLAEDRAAMAAGMSAVAARNELRGRMEALKAKARARGVVEREDVAALGTAAEGCLYSRPVDLGEAAAAVARYEERLRVGGEARQPGSAVAR